MSLDVSKYCKPTYCKPPKNSERTQLNGHFSLINFSTFELNFSERKHQFLQFVLFPSLAGSGSVISDHTHTLTPNDNSLE